MAYRRLNLLTTIALAACGNSTDPTPTPTADAPPAVTAILKAPSRSGAIAITDDRAHVAMVNPDDGTLSVFQTSDDARTAKVATGARPQAVVLAADSATAYVANRDDATIVRVRGIDTGTPDVDATVHVGSEPVALALSPTGARLFVAEFAQGRVSVIDTATMTVVKTIDVDRPRALLVTNNLDASDDDEKLIVPEFFGAPVPGREAKDDGRTGKLHVIALADLATDAPITLAPIDSGFHQGGDAAKPTVHAVPNQLGALAIAGTRVYVTAVAASPEGPARFDNNVFPVIYVADLATGAEVTGPGGTTNLARAIVDARPSPSPTSPRFLPGDLADVAFVDGRAADGSVIAYAVGRAGDVMVRTTFGPSGTQVGSTQNLEIDLAGDATIGTCQAPIGLAIDPDHGKAYVNCWVSRRMAVVDFASQQLAGTFEGSPAPVGAQALAAQRGKRFYFTGRGRWSNAGQNGAKGGEGWSSCASCHPDGLTDNMTWIFGAGPRQTTSQDGTFSHGAGPQKQRVLNWSAIFEETHDFERNTRDVSGGLGVITTAAQPSDCGQLDKETQVPLTASGNPIGGLARPLAELMNDATVATCGHKDWDDVDAFVKTIEPVHGKQGDAAAIERGRQAFLAGQCAKCHGGAGWTVSRVFFAPSATTNATLATTAFAPPTFFPTTWSYDNAGTPRSLLSGQPAIASDATGPDSPAAGIAQVACALRNVGTFGALDPSGTAALEVRPAAGALVPSEGRAGYNVPSLYGLALGAPYLHHGQAPTLTALLSDARWAFHTNAGNANFSAALGQGTTLADLVAYLLAIDAATPEVAIPTDPGTGASFDACP